MSRSIKIPRYYTPWPHQARAWERRLTGEIHYDFKLWARQLGKDQDDIQWGLYWGWNNPGTQQAYIGLDNVWINNNIFKKYVDGRTQWMDYPEDLIDVNATNKEVQLLNNPEEISPARIKYIGFLNDQAIIGSSYDTFTISEASLYPRNGFQFIEPIWDRKLAMGLPLQVNFNGTPRGTRNVMYDLMRTYSGIDDPESWGGQHGDCYIDKVTIRDAMMPDGNGGWKHLYTEEDIEKLKDRYLRQFGNLNLYYQENECKFTTVNAGLVYQAIENLETEHRFIKTNLDTSQPVYMAWDISSKGKVSDASACIVFQYINNHFVIFDWYEARGKSLLECVQELSQRPYFHQIRFAALPWDSDRSASSETPKEECERVFPNINWHSLDQERVDRGINLVRQLMPNMIINSDNCDWVMECFQNYEYKRLERQDDWAAKPKHDRHSHLMDAVRYAAMAIKEIEYLHLNANGIDDQVASYYSTTESSPVRREFNVWGERRSEGGIYY